jgi:Hypoxia induced protein conserved region
MTFANTIPVLAVAAVAVVLLMGLWNMMRGGSASRSQNLMRWRVGLQFLAIILLMTALWWSQRGA